jgi:hypothetical protein
MSKDAEELAVLATSNSKAALGRGICSLGEGRFSIPVGTNLLLAHHAYTPCKSHKSPSLAPDVQNCLDHWPGNKFCYFNLVSNCLNHFYQQEYF